MAKKIEKNLAKTVESLFKKVANLIEQARVRVATAMNVAEVYTKFQIGRYIVEEEQSGKARAEYGKQVLKGLSERLTAQYGNGWGYPFLRKIRQFYLIYSNLRITDCQIENDIQCVSNLETPSFSLTWSHYEVLMRIKNADERRFYEIEATSGNRSVRELQRQYGSSRMLRIRKRIWSRRLSAKCRNSCLNWERDFFLKPVRSVSRLMRTTTTSTWSCTIVCCSATCWWI